MSIKTKANLTTDTGIVINDNTTRDISPADVRGSFFDLIDSSINRIDDKPLLNLREYNSGRAYEIGEGSIYLGTIYQAISATTGVFTPAHWVAIVGPEVIALTALSDATISAPVNGQVLTYSGGVWVNATSSTGITSLNGLSGTSQTFAKVDDTNVTLAIASVGTIHTYTMGWSGTLANSRGGTGFGTYTTGDILYSSAVNVLSKLAIGSAGQILTVSGGVPTWQTPASSGWSINGNTLGNDTSYLGSNDNRDFHIYTNGLKRMTFLKSGEIAIGSAPISNVGLYIHGLTNATADASLKIDDLSGNTRFRVGNNGVVSIGDPWFTPLNGTAYGTFQIDSNTSTGKVYLMAVRTTYAVVGLPTGGFYCEINATNAAAGGHYGYSSIMTSTSNSEQSIGFFVDQTITSSPMNAGLYVYRLNGGTNKAGIVVAPAVNNGFGIGGAASLAATPTAIIHARGGDATSSNFGMKVEDSATTLNFSVRNDGRVFAKHLETTQGSLAAVGVAVRLGTIVTAAAALDATRYIEHEINGTVYKLALIV